MTWFYMNTYSFFISSLVMRIILQPDKVKECMIHFILVRLADVLKRIGDGDGYVLVGTGSTNENELMNECTILIRGNDHDDVRSTYASQDSERTYTHMYPSHVGTKKNKNTVKITVKLSIKHYFSLFSLT